MGFELNAVAMGLAPMQQEWIDIVTGTDQNGRPVFASTKSAKLDFDKCSVAKYQQFSALHGTSLVSAQLLNLDAGSYTVYNNANIYLTISGRPKFDSGVTTGFSVLISGITIS